MLMMMSLLVYKTMGWQIMEFPIVSIHHLRSIPKYIGWVLSLSSQHHRRHHYQLLHHNYHHDHHYYQRMINPSTQFVHHATKHGVIVPSTSAYYLHRYN